jgi:arylsulfatase A-like enzyme
MPFVRRFAAPDSTASRWEAFRPFGVRLAGESQHSRVDAATIVDRMLRWQQTVGDRRFFAMLNLFDAHDPYEPPSAWRGRFGADDDHRANYDACIAYMDSQLGRLFAELRRRGVLDRTVVIVTADHGELFGEHGMLQHSEFLYLNSIHVPLLVRYPGHVPAGRAVDTPVSLDRLPATVLDLLGDRSGAMPGLSLRAAWEGTADTSSHYAVSWIEQVPWGSRTPAAIGPVTSVVDSEWHWLLNADGRQELFHYRDDRTELRDQAGDPSRGPTMLALRAVAERHGLLP